jgi:ribosome-associated protein
VEDLVVAPGVVIHARELSWSAMRASGPGGQHVNKVSSKVDLRFDLEGSESLAPEVKARLRARAGASRLDADGRVVIQSQATREQSRNLEDAREKLAALVRAALYVPPRRKKTKPSRGAKERRLGEKKHRGEVKRARRSPGDD